MFLFNKKFLLKNDIYSLYKTVRFFKKEFLLIDLVIEDNLLNVEIDTFSNNIYDAKDDIVCLTDFNCNDNIIKRKIINGYSTITILEFITDDDGYIIQDNNKHMIELLNYIVILLEFYTNSRDDKYVNSGIVYTYILNIVGIFKTIYNKFNS